jgi:hypothetical protein
MRRFWLRLELFSASSLVLKPKRVVGRRPTGKPRMEGAATHKTVYPQQDGSRKHMNIYEYYGEAASE